MDIEMLRGIAILFVVLTHLWVLFPGLMEYYQALNRYVAFWGGVDLFFCISGYVIMRSLLSLPTAGDGLGFSRVVWPFWLRRVWRLWPLAWLWLLLGGFVVAWANRISPLEAVQTLRDDGLAALLHYMNFRWLSCANGNAVCSDIFQIYWSLSLEEQFYLLLPFLVYLLPRKRLIVVVAVLAVLQLVVPRALISGWAIVRLDALLLGVLIALAESHGMLSALSRWSQARPWFRGVFCLLCLAGVARLCSGQVSAYYTYSLLALVCSMLVLLSSFEQGIMPRTSLAGVLCWVGERSYGIYLAHCAVMVAMRECFVRIHASMGWTDSVSSMAIQGLAAAVLLAWVCEVFFKHIETPCRNYGRHLANVVCAR